MHQNQNIKANVFEKPFYPLAIFLFTGVIYRFLVPSSNADAVWKQAFLMGAVFAIVQLALSWYKNMELDYIAVGADFFLITGAAGFLGIPILLAPHAYFMQSTIFFYILIVGIVTTLTRPEGFLQRENTTNFTQKSFYGSLALLVLTGFMFLISLVLVKNLGWGTFWGAGLPFIGLLIGRAVLREKLK